MSSFTDLLSKLPEGAGKERIQAALDSCADIPDEDYLRSIIAGLTRKEVTSLLAETLDLSELDASALAGLLFAPTGGMSTIVLLCCPPMSIYHPLVSIHQLL